MPSDVASSAASCESRSDVSRSPSEYAARPSPLQDAGLGVGRHGSQLRFGRANHRARALSSVRCTGRMRDRNQRVDFEPVGIRNARDRDARW